ncbi:MAG: hypothetical protein FJY77_03635 [Candidatus Altiarchaeales archaeon]|nr:hypothetical protein [Candidatus Altiarchaeales archaeon]
MEDELLKDLVRINAIQAYINLNLLYKQELASMGDLILTDKGRESLKGMERDYMRIVEQISKIAAKYRRDKDASWDETFGGFFKVER